jgi:hypothetical protein
MQSYGVIQHTPLTCARIEALASALVTPIAASAAALLDIDSGLLLDSAEAAAVAGRGDPQVLRVSRLSSL